MWYLKWAKSAAMHPNWLHALHPLEDKAASSATPQLQEYSSLCRQTLRTSATLVSDPFLVPCVLLRLHCSHAAAHGKGSQGTAPLASLPSEQPSKQMKPTLSATSSIAQTQYNCQQAFSQEPEPRKIICVCYQLAYAAAVLLPGRFQVPRHSNSPQNYIWMPPV